MFFEAGRWVDLKMWARTAGGSMPLLKVPLQGTVVVEAMIHPLSHPYVIYIYYI